MRTRRKSHASRLIYTSPAQQILPGFEYPFDRGLDPSNRWIVLSGLIPWNEICGIYYKQVGVSFTGRPGLSPRVAIGALIIKYMCNLDDRETVEQISENLYMQYFLGYLDELSWDAFNEGSYMEEYVEKYKERFACYPREVLADKIYCTRSNRAMLKAKGIILKANSLGRPSAMSNHVSPGERNPIEGKFGQAKTGYGLNRIKARLKQTSESWIAGIFLVLNLVKLAGAKLLCLILNFCLCFSASAGQRSNQLHNILRVQH